MQKHEEQIQTIQIQDQAWKSDSVPPRPKLPKDFLKATYWDFFRSISHMFCVWGIPAFISFYVYYTDIYIGLKIAVYLIMGWISSYGIVLGEWIGHDSVHGSLLPNNKKLGIWLGLMTSSAMLGFMNTGFAARHLDHHKYTNQESDYDTIHYSKYKRLLGRLLFSRIHKTFTHMYAAYLAVKGEPKYLIPGCTLGETRLFVVANLAFTIVWMSLYATLANYNVPLFTFLVVLPIISLVFSTLLITYQQHGGTGNTDPTDYWRSTRSMTSPFWTFLHGGGNFHLEHHLYPTVPFFNLPKVHKYLKEKGYFQLNGLHLDNSHIGGHKYFSSNYPYPDPTVN